jgi:hypothetical protein|eukprot:CAMPEP_0177753934 /NCGR_PEP_ID=MMETSP0491_2-20121128/1737_1 /TAXON_ID=63592 /ORGANISM="Tetraselmis chuii, Strain PLY429" /LENGTH=348 /DNA_ID=CAMNT_0019269277 /DNA_START=362 /DNA_END=1408 /DNA_ORIENTATION=+
MGGVGGGEEEEEEEVLGTFSDLTKHIVCHGLSIFTRGRSQFVGILGAFIRANSVPKASENLRNPEADRIETILKLLNEPSLDSDEEVCFMLLQVVKILSRKQVNRARVGQIGIRAVLSHMEAPQSPRVAAEGANVILNICYERDHVISFLRCDGLPPLVRFLSYGDETVKANAAGAIQSICFQDKGRLSVRDQGAVPKLVTLLQSSNTKVVTRAVGALHNLSSDPECIQIIRKREGIPLVVDCLRADSLAVCGSAAGALQNISREVASRNIVRNLDAVAPLADLLSAQDLSAQVCAAGALLNILGPELDKSRQGERSRRGFGQLLSCVLAMSVVFDSVWEDCPSLDYQ